MHSLQFSLYLQEHPFLLFLLIAHFLGDFQLQSQDLADRKAKEWTALGRHLLIVALPLLLLTLFFPKIWLTSLLVLISHGLIDSIKRLLTGARQQQTSFLFDQVAHYIAIFAIYLSQADYLASAISSNQLQGLASISFSLRLLLFLIIITKPVNIVFKLFFSHYQTKEAEEETTISGAGALIGTLERFIIGLFLVLGQYAAIGLVFTAKSIARYDRISKSQAFAEYYLIGSLFSIISVMVIYWLLFL